jgi:acetyltransferase-like isoleucine patch superfamily enzyme
MFIIFRLKNALYTACFRLCCAPFFGSYGRRARIVAPLGIEGIGNIHIGSGVYVSHQALLAAVPHTGAAACRLEIGDGTSLGSFNHIYATERIVIGKNVLTANNVYISDNLHGYSDPATPVKQQAIRQCRAVEIGDGAWLGQNVCVVGARVGKNSVIGANSVVTRDIPDFCVAVGAPARVIKRYDFDTDQWRATDEKGDFLRAQQGS